MNTVFKFFLLYYLLRLGPVFATIEQVLVIIYYELLIVKCRKFLSADKGVG